MTYAGAAFRCKEIETPRRQSRSGLRSAMTRALGFQPGSVGIDPFSPSASVADAWVPGSSPGMTSWWASTI